MNNILEYLDSTVARFPEKIAAKDEKKQCCLRRKKHENRQKEIDYAMEKE